MIKVYHYPSIKNFDDDIVYSLTDNGGNVFTLRVSLVYHTVNVDLSYVIDANTNKEKVFDLVVHDGTDAPIIEPFEVYRFASKFTSAVTENGMIKVARVIIDDELNVLILLCRCHKDVDGFDNVIVENTHTPTYYFFKDNEWFLKMRKALFNKYKLIKDVDIYDSISYLEAQVDLLTKLVIALYDDGADEKSMNLLKIANEYSVLDIKPDDAIEEEFTNHKATFRERQKKYYENRP